MYTHKLALVIFGLSMIVFTASNKAAAYTDFSALSKSNTYKNYHDYSAIPIRTISDECYYHIRSSIILKIIDCTI